MTDVAKPLNLRLWPGVALPLVTLTAVFLPGFIVPGTLLQFLCMMVGPAVGAVGLVAWWLFASGAPLRGRLVMFLLFIASGLVAVVVADASMPIGLYMFGISSVGLAFTVWLYASGVRTWRVRQIGAWLTILAAWGFWTAVRCDGLDGRVIPDLAWRWTLTPEERYVASLSDSPATHIGHAAQGAAPTEVALTDCPGFRGLNRNGHVTSFLMETDWKSHPPEELWRRPIGPGWSSFAVVGGRAFTQEQRGDDEVVLCLDADSGEELWSHGTGTRFWEVVGGAGPRATPTFAEGKIFALGANGYLACLDAVTGRECWTREIAEDGPASVPMWGFASSPLVIDGRLFVFAGGGSGNSVLAYDTQTGQLLWSAGGGTHSYSSPHLADFAGVKQILMVTEQGIGSLSPEDGEMLWEHAWPMPGYRVVQPNVIEDQVLIGTNNGMGTRLLTVKSVGDRWLVEESWTSRGLKPYFNDFVIHEGHVYGFDNSILVCLDLRTGERRWKGGRYGTGQMLLLPEQDLLLISTEKSGEVVLVETRPAAHTEIARYEVLEGKTWNHPVIADGRLFVRNGAQAACFELAAAPVEF